MGIYYLRSMPTYSFYIVCKPRMTKLGQGVEVMAHYPNFENNKCGEHSMIFQVEVNGWFNGTTNDLESSG